MKPIVLGIVLALLPAKPPTAQITLSPTSLTISAPQGGPVPAPSTLTVQNSGDGKLNWSAVPSASWIQVSPASGTLNKSASIGLAVTVVLTGLAAGDYTGSIAVSDPNASNSPQHCGVTLHVSALPQLSLSPGSLSWTAPDGGASPPSQTLTVQNAGGGSLTWSGTSNVAWLTASPSSGTLAAGAFQTVTLSVDSSGQQPGTYPGTWTVTSAAASNSPQRLAATLTVSPVPVINVAPTSLTFDAPQGGANPSPSTLTVSNEGSGALGWTATSDASWLGVSPSSGSVASGGAQALTVTVSTSGLSEGTYLAAVHFGATGTSNTPPTIPVTLNVNAQPKIDTNPNSVSFTVAADQPNSSPAGISVTNVGSGTLVWGATSGVSWLGVSPQGGSLAPLASQPLLLGAAASGMAPGHYTTTVSIADPNASNSPQTVAVDLIVTASSLPTSAPAGQCGLLGPEPLVLLVLIAQGRRRRNGDPHP